MNTPDRLKPYLYLFVIVLTVSACRFQVPSAGEGRELARKGVFPSTTPSWVKQPEDGESFKPSSSGVIPHAYTTPPAVQVSAANVPDVNVETGPSPAEKKRRIRLERAAGAGVDQENTSGPVGSEKDDSPLDRIAALCPAGVEIAASDALRTESLALRMEKYELLVKRCPESADLWIWLGQDYQSAGNLLRAKRAYETALSLNRGNEKAQALLGSVKKELNEKAASGR